MMCHAVNTNDMRAFVRLCKSIVLFMLRTQATLHSVSICKQWPFFTSSSLPSILKMF